MTKSKIQYLYDIGKCDVEGEASSSAGSNMYEDLLRDLGSNIEMSFVTLWDVSSNASNQCDTLNTLVSENKISSKTIGHTEHSSTDGFETIRELASARRYNLGLTDPTKMFIAIAWLSQDQLRYIKMF